MAVRPNSVPIASTIAPVQSPSAGGGSSVVWGILARGADEAAAMAHQRYDKQVAVSANDQGVLDAIMGRVRKLDRSTTRGAAYMDAALSTTKVQAETNALLSMQDMYRETPNDPATLQARINNYTEGLVGQIAPLDPATAVELRQRILTQSIPMINGAISNLEQQTAEAKKLAEKQAEGQELTTITQNAADIFTDQSGAPMAAILAAHRNASRYQSADAADGFLISRLTSGHDASAIANMQTELKTRLAAMFEGAPDDIKTGLGIYSGWRSIARQTQLYNASDRSGRMVAAPGHSQHNLGNAADLAFNGESLGNKGVPQNVRDWVHAHAADYGLKFPMSYEPWHVEVQETRGGQPFVGSPAHQVAGTMTQEHYDRIIGTGFRSWFRNQSDKSKAYMDFVNGDTTLPMAVPNADGTVSTLNVNVRNSLSLAEQQSTEENLRAQMSFELEARNQIEKDSKAAVVARSEETRVGFMTGILADGATMNIGGRQIKAVRPTQEQLLTALNNNDLTPKDYEDLTRANTEARPFHSDENLKRQAFTLIVQGENPQSFIMENLPALSVDDAKQMIDYYGARTNAAGELNPTQKFYVDQLDATFAQNMLDKIDTSKQERKVASVIEARQRMLEGEPPKAVFDDISQRAKFDAGIAPGSPPFPRPRFSQPDPANPDKINVEASFNALEKAFNEHAISDPDYVRQKRLLQDWDIMQQKAAAADAAAPAGTP